MSSLKRGPGGEEIIAGFRECGRFARANNLRLSFHPDQFVVLNSPNPQTLAHSLAEMNYQAEVAHWVGAETINLHGGGAYGDKAAALGALRRQIEGLPEPVRSRLTLENDDKVYTPTDLLPVCADTGVPLVYDVHHHRCLPDGLSVAEATERAPAGHGGASRSFTSPVRSRGGADQSRSGITTTSMPAISPWSGWVGHSRWKSRPRPRNSQSPG